MRGVGRVNLGWGERAWLTLKRGVVMVNRRVWERDGRCPPPPQKMIGLEFCLDVVSFDWCGHI